MSQVIQQPISIYFVKLLINSLFYIPQLYSIRGVTIHKYFLQFSDTETKYPLEMEIDLIIRYSSEMDIHYNKWISILKRGYSM